MQDIATVAANTVIPVIKGAAQTAGGIIQGILFVGGGGSGSGKGKEMKNYSQVKQELVNKVRSSQVFVYRNAVRMAGLSGALAIALGAYGAHVVMTNDKIPNERKVAFQTANLYHFIGTGGLVAASLGKFPKVTSILMVTGALLFCGSCYFYALTGKENVKKLAPAGGTCLIVAWLSLIL